MRHAQPEWTRDGLTVVDPPLTELGRVQAERLAEALAAEHRSRGPFDEVFVSPMVRARETAAPVLAALGRDEVVAPWLEEIRDPVWHGSPAEKAEKAYAELRGRRSEDRWNGLDGGESVRGFVDRIHAGATEFFGERGVARAGTVLPVWDITEPGRRIVLVAHAGTNSVTICHLLGLEPTPWEWDRFVLGHTSISRLEAVPLGDGYTFSLTRLSDQEHLPLVERTR